ncbi:MAG: antibiotic biosynthesis monooxygenase [Desulfatitalea sp. BRH_c12]|nr:MAG: antibiotic biosynthesis monooxygenase [Desulfatitalea sp. BRH_c12]
MIIVKIIMNVIPEKQKELVQTLLSVMAAMEKEEGCLSHTLFGAIENNNQLNLLVEWQTRKCLDRHLRSKMFGVLLGTRSLLNEPHAIRIYTVLRSEGMESVHTARGKEFERA